MTIIRHYRGGLRPSGGGGGGGSAPAWVSAINTFPNWSLIANGTGSGNAGGAKLASCIVAPNCSDPPGGWGHTNAVFDSYTGTTIDQVRKELIVAASGGHGDGANNGCYALALGNDTPGWRRLVDSTPDSVLSGTLDVDTFGGKFADGRPRSMHASNVVWAGGSGVTTARVWFPMQSSVTSSEGGHADNVLSFNRESLGAGTSPLAWTNSNIGPWTFWGSSNQNNNTYGFGAGLFDSVNKQIIAVNCAGGSFGVWWQKIPVTGGSEGVSTAYNDTSIDVNLCWAQICPDLGIVVAGDSDFDRVCVLNISTNTWAAPSQSGTPYTPYVGSGNYIGVVYVPASRSLVLTDPKNTGSTYYKLAIPMSGSSYNPAGTWVWSSGTMSGYPTIAAGDYGNDAQAEWTSCKFSKIEDVGDGTSVLVLPVHYNRPVYVSKIPSGGI